MVAPTQEPEYDQGLVQPLGLPGTTRAAAVDTGLPLELFPLEATFGSGVFGHGGAVGGDAAVSADFASSNGMLTQVTFADLTALPHRDAEEDNAVATFSLSGTSRLQHQASSHSLSSTANVARALGLGYMGDKEAAAADAGADAGADADAVETLEFGRGAASPSAPSNQGATAAREDR